MSRELLTSLPPARGRDVRGVYDYSALLDRLTGARIGASHVEVLCEMSREYLAHHLAPADVAELAEYLERCAHVTPPWASKAGA